MRLGGVEETNLFRRGLGMSILLILVLLSVYLIDQRGAPISRILSGGFGVCVPSQDLRLNHGYY